MKHEKKRRIRVKEKEKELKRKINAILDGMTAEQLLPPNPKEKKSNDQR